ncbi:nucleolar protein 9 isoform X2 [Pyxicephalus adspersus]|uniref:nucleolar protein 9 isoform X2 n=1 Tax=Pyxicephalus adspersus TaxID=30357 RepID=UPI003B59E849
MGTEKRTKGNDKKRTKRADGENSESSRPAKKQKKADNPPPTRPADPKKSQPENALPRLDPKSVGYFRRVGETLQQGFQSDEDRSLFVRNVFNEVTGNELALATDMSGSLVMQKLLAVAASSQLCQLLKVLSGHWQEVCWHRSGAHVIQTSLLQYPRFQSKEKTEEEEEEEEKEKDEEPGADLEELIMSLCAEVKGKFLLYNQNTHGSYIVRTLFQVLSGTILNLETNKKGASGPAVSSEFDVPESFLTQLQDLSGLFCENIGVFATNKVASVGMQVALQVLHRKLPPTCAALCNDVIKYLSSRNVSADSSSLLVFLKDETSSRLLERILEVSDKKQLRSLYYSHFQGQLHMLSVHPIANYTVQRLIRATQTKKLFSTLFDELSPAMEDILAKGHMGLITSLAESCKKLSCRQAELVTNLMEAFHCNTPASRRITCIPLFLSLLTYEIYYKIEEEEKPSEHTNAEAKLQSVNYHGSILVQHFLHFEDPSLALQSLGNMPEDDLRTVACSQAGSHVFDALLTSDTVTEKQRKKVLRKLRAHVVDLARNKFGSRVLDRIWNVSTMGVKEEIAQKLVERLRELQNDPIGHHIVRNFALTHFTKRRKDWEAHQQSENKRRKMFAEILED